MFCADQINQVLDHPSGDVDNQIILLLRRLVSPATDLETF